MSRLKLPASTDSVFKIQVRFKETMGTRMHAFMRGTFALIVCTLSTGLLAAADLKAGDSAPDFSLQASDGKTYMLSEFRGKQAIVVAWFPKAYTRGCTLECKSLAEHGDLIKHFDVTYFMASVDPLDRNTGFAQQEHADFPLLSDPTKQIARRYGVLGAIGLAHRWTFYIGRDGRILAIDKNIKASTSAEDMATQLRLLGVQVRRSVRALVLPATVNARRATTIASAAPITAAPEGGGW